VLQGSLVGKGAKSDLEQAAKLVQAKLKRESDDLESVRAKIAKQASLLSPDALEVKAESFRKKERELARKVKDEKEKLDRESSKKIARIVKDIDVLVASLAKEKDYPIVLEYDPRVVVYVDKKYDLTSQIIEALDKKRTSL
jgi:Skp family chaperone for outer membrane proteins